MTHRLALPVAMLWLAGCASTVGTVEPTVSVPPATSSTSADEPQALPEPVKLPPPPKPPLRIVAVGDIMLGSDFPADRLPPHDGATSFSRVADLLRDADVTFGNLEGVLQDGGEPFKVCNNPKLCYLFRTPTHYVQYFADAGFDVMSLANNHARDFGEEGRTNTMLALDAVGIAHSGRIDDVARWQYQNYSLAMIAFAPNPGSFDLNNVDAAVSLVTQLSAEHDIVIVSFHGGAEGVDALHVTFGTEFYYGEERGNVVDFSHQVIDAGADLVIGHGPHVPRGLELYKGRLIAYSLGNFNTYQGISIAGLKGLAPILEVRIGETGEFLDGRVISTRQMRPGGPRPDVSHEAALLMKRLSEEDFGQRAPLIDKEGNLSRSEP